MPTDEEHRLLHMENKTTFKVRVLHAQAPSKKEQFYDSLADFWTEWYQQYRKAIFPRLIVRFEDTLFHAETIMEKIGECVGRPIQKPYKYFLEAAKSHGDSIDLEAALFKYGTDRGRLSSLTCSDLEYAQKALDPELMRMFHYQQPEIYDIS